MLFLYFEHLSQVISIPSLDDGSITKSEEIMISKGFITICLSVLKIIIFPAHVIDKDKNKNSKYKL